MSQFPSASDEGQGRVEGDDTKALVSRLLDAVNKSGFPFQMAVAAHVGNSENRYSWSVQSEEHPWKSPDGDSGFLDLVLAQGQVSAHDRPSTVLAIECKRSFADWIFLVRSDANNGQVRANALWLLRPMKGGVNWAEFRAHPPSYESAFAIIRDGKSGGKTGLELEGLARDALSATRGLRSQTPRTGGPSLYVPVILTSARLWVLTFDPAGVPLADGNVRVEGSNAEEVPLVRFRKGFEAPDGREYDKGSYRSIGEELARTVFVVSISGLPSFLNGWSPFEHGDWPWKS